MQNRNLSKSAFRRRRRRRRTLMVTLLLFFVLLGTAVTLTLLFKISAIEIDGASQYSDDQIIELLPVTIGNNIFSFNPKSCEEEIRKNLIYLEDIKVRRRLPSTVVVIVTPSVEKFALVIDEKEYFLSQSLRLLSPIEADSSLCTILGYEPEKTSFGDVIISLNSEKTELLVQLIEDLEKVGILDSTTEIDISDTLNMSIIYDRRVSVLLGTDLALLYKLELTAKVLKENIQDTSTGIIDATIQGKAVFKST